MGIIALEGMLFHGHHGVHSGERQLDTQFRVDVQIKADVKEAERKDQLKKTIDYQEVYHIVHKEMQISVNLIEHLAHKTAKAIKKNFDGIDQVTVKITKLNPPFGGQVEGVSFTSVVK